MEGKGVTKNIEEAKKWHHKAAKQGLAHSQFMLGYLYVFAEKDRTPSNLLEAFKWLSISADRNHEGAAELRDRVKEYLSKEQIAQIEESIKDWEPEK